MVRQYFDVTPSASRLTGSLRDIGYDFPAAVADIVDNSIAAGASEIRIEVEFDGLNSTVTIADDGDGMGPSQLNEALRFGSRRDYATGDLGRYGLGLKTASLSQCRILTVASRRRTSERTYVRQLDIDLIEELDRWAITEPGSTTITRKVREIIRGGMSTVVVWDYLDRALPERNAEGGWARRRLETLRTRTEVHLAMVFHRFLDIEDPATDIAIVVNGRKLEPWDPFARVETNTLTLPAQSFELSQESLTGTVTLRPFVLPARNSVSTPEAWERLAGPMKWNRQQGLYIYRADRLVQWGGWGGIRAIDEHTKLARAVLDFDTDLDPLFNINVAKMRVSLPAQLRQMLERPINEVCIRADAIYRRGASQRPASGAAESDVDGVIIAGDDKHGSQRPTSASASDEPTDSSSGTRSASFALRAAAMQTGDFDALRRIAAVLREQAPVVALGLGLDEL